MAHFTFSFFIYLFATHTYRINADEIEALRKRYIEILLKRNYGAYEY